MWSVFAQRGSVEKSRVLDSRCDSVRPLSDVVELTSRSPDPWCSWHYFTSYFLGPWCNESGSRL